MAIVEEIIATVPFFILREISYVYEHGVYLEDLNGCLLKRKIQEHLYRKMIRYPAISRIYALLVCQPEVEDCKIYDRMTEEEKEQHRQNKSDYGLEGFEYKRRKQ
ncbi:MAG: hypothetical protein IJ567_03675 [Lachnospiraceae bacterium]|nr:hypothetical protein [Lachnospiraceae bacterium]